MNVTMKLHDRNGDIQEVELPGKYEACSKCGGKGSTVNPAVDGHGISPEEFAEDPDFEEAYHAGVYDIPCPECHGKRVVPVADVGRCTYAQKRLLISEWMWQREEGEYRAMVRSEQRLMGVY